MWAWPWAAAVNKEANILLGVINNTNFSGPWLAFLDKGSNLQSGGGVNLLNSPHYLLILLGFLKFSHENETILSPPETSLDPTILS